MLKSKGEEFECRCGSTKVYIAEHLQKAVCANCSSSYEVSAPDLGEEYFEEEEDVMSKAIAVEVLRSTKDALLKAKRNQEKALATVNEHLTVVNRQLTDLLNQQVTLDEVIEEGTNASN